MPVANHQLQTNVQQVYRTLYSQVAAAIGAATDNNAMLVQIWEEKKSKPEPKKLRMTLIWASYFWGI